MISFDEMSFRFHQSVMYQLGSISGHAGSLWQIEHTKIKFCAGFFSWDCAVRLRHVTTGRYLGILSQPVGGTGHIDVVLLTASEADNAASVFYMKQTKVGCPHFSHSLVLISVDLRGFTIFFKYSMNLASSALNLFILSLRTIHSWSPRRHYHNRNQHQHRNYHHNATSLPKSTQFFAFFYNVCVHNHDKDTCLFVLLQSSLIIASFIHFLYRMTKGRLRIMNRRAWVTQTSVLEKH